MAIKFSWTPTDPWVQSSPKRCHLSTPSAHVDQPWVSRALHFFTWFDVIPRRPGLVVAFRNVGEKMPTKETVVFGGASCWTLSVGWRVTLYFCMTFILRPVIWNHARQEVRLCSVLDQNVRFLTLIHLILRLPRIFLHINLDNFELI